MLRFSPTAWAKLLYLRDRGETEVGGFALAPADDLLFVDDVHLVSQQCTVMTVAFEDEAVADFFDRQVDRGLRPEQFARIWIHTHPGNCPEPSLTDERTLERVFGKADWAIMFILARGGQSYARLSFNVGPGGAMTIPTCIDYSRPFGGSDAASWEAEYRANVMQAPIMPLPLAEAWDDGFGLERLINEKGPWPDEFAGQGEDDHDFDFERFLI
jgi:proteasome lid subunit RPN8/RPN11